VAHRLEAPVKSIDSNDNNNDKRHYEFNRMDYVASLRQNYFTLLEHRQKRNEQHDQEKSATSHSSLRKTPSPLADGIENIEVDGVKQQDPKHPSSFNVAANSSCSASTARSGPSTIGRPPQHPHPQQRWSSSSSAASWSQSQEQHHFNNSDGNHDTPHQYQQEQEQRQLVQPDPETIDLTTAIEGRDDGLEYDHDDTKKGDNQSRIRRTTPSPTRHASPLGARSVTPLSAWTSIADRRYQQAHKRQQQHRNNKAASPTQYRHERRFEDLDDFIDQY
jgi:hypothetical protein